VTATDVVRDWLASRVDSGLQEGLRSLLQSLVEDLCTATGEAATLHRLTTGGQHLVPLAGHHPAPEAQTEVVSAPAQTTSVADSGLWRHVVERSVPVRWHVPAGVVPAEATAEQAEHLRRSPVRAVLAAPLLTSDGELVGGVALHRCALDAPFTEADEHLLVAFAAQVADLAALVRAGPA